MSKKILFFGNERLATGATTAAPALNALIAAGYEVAAVIVAQNDAGKSRKARPLEVAEAAAKHGIPVLSPVNLVQAKDELAAFGAQAGVLIAYGKIVPPEVLELFPAGIINIHPSLLPLHRGSTPIESAILDGEARTGVSLMKLSAKMDAGPLYARKSLPLTGTETKQALADTLAAMGTDILIGQLPGILDGSVQPKPQEENAATYDGHISKADGVIDWSKPAARLEREIRAYSQWPRSRTTLGMTDVIVTAAHTTEGSADPGTLQIENKQISVACGENMLVIDSLIPSGKREMTGPAFLAGYKSL